MNDGGGWLNTEGWERENEQHGKFGLRDMTSETAYLIRVEQRPID
jgi:hypothetical protein